MRKKRRGRKEEKKEDQKKRRQERGGRIDYSLKNYKSDERFHAFKNLNSKFQ